MEKIKRAVEEARRRREAARERQNASAADHSDVDAQLRQRIRQTNPINALPEYYQDSLARAGEIIALNRGETVFRAGTRDAFLHYLLDGEVTLRGGERASRRVSAREMAVPNALDEAGRTRKETAVAESAIKVFRIPGAVLHREVNLAETAPPPAPEVMDLDDEAPSEWIVVWLRAGMFAHLPMEAIQHVLARAEDMDVAAGAVIIEQDEPADAFYLIKRGRAVVLRKARTATAPVQLAELEAGDGFGEEGLIGPGRRNATVVMATDGELLRLRKSDFETLIRDPLLRTMTLDDGKRAVAEGARWIDARDARDFAAGALPGAVNLPLPLLRLKHGELDPDRRYVVYSDSTDLSAVAAFLLAARGFEVLYIAEAVQPPAAQSRPNPLEISIKTVPSTQQVLESAEAVTDPGETPLPPSSYADTLTGQRLAKLVAEIHADAREVAGAPVSKPGEQTLSGTTDLQLEDALFEAGGEPPPAPATPAGTVPDSARGRDGAGLPAPVAAALNALERSLREQFEMMRTREHERVTREIERRTNLIRGRAETLVRERIREARKRDRERLSDIERRLRSRYARLTDLANRITHQKAEIQRARREIEDKLRAAETVHRELQLLGRNLSREIDELGGSLPDLQALGTVP